jgi:hypothetical protein
MLTGFLKEETDHYKDRKREVISEWLMKNKSQLTQSTSDAEDWNTNDLSQALKDFSKDNVQHRIKQLQALRDAHLAMGVDNERHQTQTQLTKSEKHRYGASRRNQLITEVNREFTDWNYVFNSKKNAPGHTINRYR